MNVRARLVFIAFAATAAGLFIFLLSRWPDTTASQTDFPIVAPIGPERVRPEIAANSFGSVTILAADGSLWGWGQNLAGQLASSLPRAVPIPRPLRQGSDWAAVGSGFDFTVAAKTNGTLWAWGPGHSNVNTAAGVRSPNYGPSAVPVDSANDWRVVAAGLTHVAALKADGTLWVWGMDDHNQLADGTRIKRLTPIRLDDCSNWVGIASGAFHTAAVRRDGTLWVWGADPLATNRTGPSRVGAETNWVSVYAGEFHTIACKRDGSCWVWGDNAPLMMSPNHHLERDVLIEVKPAHPWRAVAGGNGHCLALDTDGSLWSWGDNHYGQIGDGTTLPRTSPVRIGGRNDWVAIGALSGTSIALAQDGSLWTWGIRIDLPQRISPLARLAGDAARLLGFNVAWGRSGPPTIATAPWCILQFVQPTKKLGVPPSGGPF